MYPGALLCRAMLMVGMACMFAGAAHAGWRSAGPLFVLVLFLAWIRSRRWEGEGYAHGTARLADFHDLLAYGLVYLNSGLVLGRSDYTPAPSRPYALQMLFRLPLRQSETAVRLFQAAFFRLKAKHASLIRINKFVHLATFAATGRGKGVAVLIPNLLSYASSCVVTDPKAELFKLTATHRRTKFGHRVVRLDPFGIAGPGSDAWNPLDLIGPNSPNLIDEAKDLANMLVIRTGEEREPHFNDSAELVLTAFIAFVAACETSPEHRNLQTVREILCNRKKFEKAVETMQRSPIFNGFLQRYGHLLTWYVDRELGSVLTTVQRHTVFLDSPAVAASTSRSTFDPRELRQNRTTVYLCLPHDRLESNASLQRLWIGTILRSVSSHGADESNPVLFLLDEAGHIGRNLRVLEEAVTLLRGMGVRLWFFFQSVGQVAECFGDRAGIFLDNIDTQQFFGINAYESAEMVSKRLGDSTITNVSYQRGVSNSYSSGQGTNGSSSSKSVNESFSYSEMARRVLKPEEVLRMPEDMAIVFHRNLPPIVAGLVRYFEAPEFRRGGTGQGSRRGLGVRVVTRSLATLALGAVCLALSFRVSAALRPPDPSSARIQESVPLQPIPAAYTPALRTGQRSGR